MKVYIVCAGWEEGHMNLRVFVNKDDAEALIVVIEEYEKTKPVEEQTGDIPYEEYKKKSDEYYEKLSLWESNHPMAITFVDGKKYWNSMYDNFFIEEYEVIP